MMFGMLFRNESIKTFKRPAFWVTYGFFLFIMTMEFGSDYFNARSDPERTFDLPGSWQSILGNNTDVALIFGSVLILLLIASEFSWRTARQNVIDGLSKEQFFLAKLLVVPLIGLLFIGGQVLVGTTFALLGTDFSTLTEPLITRVQWSALGGFYLAFLGYGSLSTLR